jgi:hypothetical protein
LPASVDFLLGLLFDPEDGGDVPPKRQLTSNGIHCVMSRKIERFMTTPVRALNPKTDILFAILVRKKIRLLLRSPCLLCVSVTPFKLLNQLIVWHEYFAFRGHRVVLINSVDSVMTTWQKSKLFT